MKKVFLGGTCNESTWREKLIPMLNVSYFNPVVEDWNEAAMQEEQHQRKICDFCLYAITPKMSGVYSIAEVIDDSNKRPEKTIFCVLMKDAPDLEFTTRQLRSLDQVGKMVVKNGGEYFKTLRDVADYINEQNI